MVDMVFVAYSLTLIATITVWLKSKLLFGMWLVKLGLALATCLFQVSYFTLCDTHDLLNLLILYQYLNIQTLLCDVEDSREKLDRFFSYNFLFFDDE